MLDKHELANNIINSFRNIQSNSANTYLQELANQINTYVLNNTEIRFAWNAIQTFPPVPMPPPDPIIQANGRLFNVNIVLTPSMASNRIQALNHLKSEIYQGFSNSYYVITDTGFSVSTGLLTSANNFYSLSIDVHGNNQYDAILKLCDDIISWIKSLMPSQICSGTRTTQTGIIYTGTGNVTQIL